MSARSRGYSLLEVMTAVVLLAIALPALTKWVLYGRNAQVNGSRQELASILAQQTFDSLAELTKVGRTPRSDLQATSGNQSFSVSWSWLSPHSPYSGVRPGACQVVVSWRDGARTRSTKLTGALP
jgi:prepilin-type N-terminal cleavage/methylation domain-containing protein